MGINKKVIDFTGKIWYNSIKYIIGALRRLRD